ncbi:MarR family winged helix-turn-helix transcriptional regulator [Streptomyces sp. NBC_00988]|uniref:MarR family winged helix-turn-helix transcriptional regulator n=1 Tax=Streptomyces sp. NBC_00988 TaxID=2903704 RepID=UPI0038692753|nr:MarR family winged helix-turn-helix transcriptional regulator [Streptomyces sp. NBC_00988]
MPTGPKWLDAREDRAWRTFVHAHHQLRVRLERHLIQDSGLSEADYEVLAVLSECPGERASARELCDLLSWEKSRLSHQVRGMQRRGLVTREPNPDDARSCLVLLLPAGYRAIEGAAPRHVGNVRMYFIDLLTPGELDTLVAVHERILRRLADEPARDDGTAGG